MRPIKIKAGRKQSFTGAMRTSKTIIEKKLDKVQFYEKYKN